MDLALRNATLIDGSGAAPLSRRPRDLDGRIVAIGDVPGQADEEIDVGGAVVAPGFIDVHTHYDAQVFWDPMLSPSVYHGVTTVLAGNCGFTLAPLSGRKEDSDYLLGMLSRVEGMPLAALEAGVKPDWHTFGEFLDAAGRQGRDQHRLHGRPQHAPAPRDGRARRRPRGDRRTRSQAMCDLLRQSLARRRHGLLEHAWAGALRPVRPAGAVALVDARGDAGPGQVVAEFPGTWVR